MLFYNPPLVSYFGEAFANFLLTRATVLGKSLGVCAQTQQIINRLLGPCLVSATLLGQGIDRRLRQAMPAYRSSTGLACFVTPRACDEQILFMRTAQFGVGSPVHEVRLVAATSGEASVLGPAVASFDDPDADWLKDQCDDGEVAACNFAGFAYDDKKFNKRLGQF